MKVKMSSLKKNFFYNALLTVSNYIFPLLTFPYITRVLGAEGFGIANFAFSFVENAILFCNLGISTIGVKAIASCKKNKEEMSKVFSTLVTIHMCVTLFISVVYLSIVLYSNSLQEQKEFLLLGTSRIILNVFLVEWLYQGLQDFAYITKRSIIVKTLYVISIFVFVKTNQDYGLYFALTIIQFIINYSLNWIHSRKIVYFNLSLKGCSTYLKPILTWGITNIVLSFYTTFNVTYLGMVCNNESVGYYVTAVKLYAIFLSVLTAYNTVIIPHLNEINTHGNMSRLKNMISLSFELVSFVSFPLVIFCVVMAPEIIEIIAGTGFERSIIPFQIIVIQVILVGYSQITEGQILLTFNKNKEVLISTICSALFSVVILFFCAKRYAEIASALAVAIPHILECILLFIFAKKALNFRFPLKTALNSIVVACIFGVVLSFFKCYISNLYIKLVVLFLFYSIFYILVQLCLCKDMSIFKILRENIFTTKNEHLVR